MRAYMSDRTRRQLPLHDGFASDGLALASKAEFEARAILADVEPCPRLEDWTMALSLACFPAESFMGECVKESLAAFVGEGC